MFGAGAKVFVRSKHLEVVTEGTVVVVVGWLVAAHSLGWAVVAAAYACSRNGRARAAERKHANTINGCRISRRVWHMRNGRE